MKARSLVVVIGAPGLETESVVCGIVRAQVEAGAARLVAVVGPGAGAQGALATWGGPLQQVATRHHCARSGEEAAVALDRLADEQEALLPRLAEAYTKPTAADEDTAARAAASCVLVVDGLGAEDIHRSAAFRGVCRNYRCLNMFVVLAVPSMAAIPSAAAYLSDYVVAMPGMPERQLRALVRAYFHPQDGEVPPAVAALSAIASARLPAVVDLTTCAAPAAGQMAPHVAPWAPPTPQAHAC